MSVHICFCYFPVSFVNCFRVGTTLLRQLGEKIAQCTASIFVNLGHILRSGCERFYKKLSGLCIQAGLFFQDKIRQALPCFFKEAVKVPARDVQKPAQKILETFRSETWESGRSLLQQAIDLHKDLLKKKQLLEFKKIEYDDPEFVCLAARWTVRTFVFKSHPGEKIYYFPHYLNWNQEKEMIRLVKKFNILTETEKQKAIYYTGFLEEKDKSIFPKDGCIRTFLDGIDDLSYELLSNRLFYELIPKIKLN
jgi:hypothetical protein